MIEPVEPVVRANLRRIVSSYRRATGLSLSTVSLKFYGNHDFLKLFFAKEASISLNKLDKMLRLFSSRWPAGVDRPMLRAVFMDRVSAR